MHFILLFRFLALASPSVLRTRGRETPQLWQNFPRYCSTTDVAHHAVPNSHVDLLLGANLVSFIALVVSGSLSQSLKHRILQISTVCLTTMSGVCMSHQGSHGFIERLPVDKSKSITFGAETVGVGDATVLTKVDVKCLLVWLSLGSRRSHLHRHDSSLHTDLEFR